MRYVPDPVKNEFINIGVLLRDAGDPASTTVRFTRDWKRVRCLDPDADVAMLEGLETDLRLRLAAQGDGQGGVQPVLSMLQDSFSNAVQLTPAQGCLAESTAAQLEQLMRLYVEPRKHPAVAKTAGRVAIHGQISPNSAIASTADSNCRI